MGYTWRLQGTKGFSSTPIRTSFLPLSVLVVIVLSLGGYASWLNHQFYARQAPFFDSASYTNYLARVAGATQLDNLKDGLDVALNGSTTPLPGLEALALALLHVPISSTRQLGVWLQVIWLLALAVSLFNYWLYARLRGLWSSVLLTLPFLFFAGIFKFNGGLPDFRLDLTLYILLACASVWYLRTYSAPSAKDARLAWLLAGAFVTLASLSRATAPVYWAVMAGPLLLIRLVLERGERKQLVLGVGWMILPSFAVALPYFVSHFSYLYYYYAQWNQDANARLPLEESMAHFRFAWQHVGWAMGSAGVLFFAAVLWDARGRAFHFDWKLLYLGSAPVLFLVFRGAGLNPFVCMPAIFGCLMFLFAPLKGDGPAVRAVWTQGASLLLLTACVWNVAQAPGQVGYPETRMSAIRQGIDWMREDAQKKKLPIVDFVTFYNWNYHPYFIRNVLINEYGYRAARWSLVSPEGIRWEPYHVWKHSEASYELPFTASVALVWQEEVAGTTDDEKIDWMYRTALKDINYVYFPDDATIDFMEKYIAANFINTKVRAIKSRFLSTGDWEKLGTPLAITDFERVQLYSKRRPSEIGEHRLSPLP
jgi:hypothetical protein